MSTPELHKLADALEIAARQHGQSNSACLEAAAFLRNLNPAPTPDPVHAAICAFLEDYQYPGANSGVGLSDYQRSVVTDAIMGLLEDPDFQMAYSERFEPKKRPDGKSLREDLMDLQEKALAAVAEALAEHDEATAHPLGFLIIRRG